MTFDFKINVIECFKIISLIASLEILVFGT